MASDETERQAEAMAAAAAEAAEDSEDDDDESDGAGEGSGSGEKTARTQPGMYISTPPVLKEKIEAEAAAAGKSARVYVRDLLAAQWGLVLPEPRTRTKYGSDEEKLAAQKQKSQARQELIKRLLAEHRAAQQEAAAQANAASTGASA